MYHYLGCGLAHVWLANGYEKTKTPYGDGVVIHNLANLHDALGQAIVCATRPLSGAEFRFLRNQLELSQEGLGALLGCSAQSIARWEKGSSKKVDPAADRLLRVIYWEAKITRKLKKLLDRLAEIESVPRSKRQKLVVTEHKSSWHAEAA